MPEDILYEITGFLLYGQYSPGRQDDIPLNRRKATFALASCCRWMRAVILGRWLLRDLAVTLCPEDLSVIDGLPLETRAQVR